MKVSQRLLEQRLIAPDAALRCKSPMPRQSRSWPNCLTTLCKHRQVRPQLCLRGTSSCCIRCGVVSLVRLPGQSFSRLQRC